MMKYRFQNRRANESYNPAYNSGRGMILGLFPKANKYLNSWLTYILCLQMILSAVGLVMGFVDLITKPEGIQTIDLLELLLSTIPVVGALLLLLVKRIGFYLMVIPYLLVGILCMIPPCQWEGVEMCFGEIAFIMLLMLLKKNGKNAYQVLWNKPDKD